MSRPLKDGVDYFNKDCDFYQDEKVRLLRAEYGAKGMYLLDYLLCEIYGKTGYYIRWDDKTCYLVSDGAGCGLTPGFVAEFVAGCIRCSFFDERVASVFGVLTSAGIQRRFIRMIAKRETVEFIEDYFLLDVNSKKDVPEGSLAKVVFKKITSTENIVKVPDNPEKVGNNAQRKVKESKYNTHTKSAPARASEEAVEQEEALSLPDETEIAAEFRKLKLKEPEAEARAFVEYNSRNGWTGDWKLKAALWAKRATKKTYNTARAKGKDENSTFDEDEFFKAALKATYGSLEANGGGEIGKKRNLTFIRYALTTPAGMTRAKNGRYRADHQMHLQDVKHEFYYDWLPIGQAEAIAYGSLLPECSPLPACPVFETIFCIEACGATTRANLDRRDEINEIYKE